MTDKKQKKRQPITLGPAVRLSLTPEQEEDLRAVSRETGISQKTILQRLEDALYEPIMDLENALRMLNVRQVALQMKLDELEELKAKLAAMNKDGGE